MAIAPTNKREADKYGCAPGATSSIKKRAEAERLRHGRRL